jgi:hypothetical protein
MTDKPANQMHVTRALAMIEQLLASQRNYQACAVLKSACEYIELLERRVAELTPPVVDDTVATMDAAE